MFFVTSGNSVLCPRLIQTHVLECILGERESDTDFDSEQSERADQQAEARGEPSAISSR